MTLRKKLEWPIQETIVLTRNMGYHIPQNPLFITNSGFGLCELAAHDATNFQTRGVIVSQKLLERVRKVIGDHLFGTSRRPVPVRVANTRTGGLGSLERAEKVRLLRTYATESDTLAQVGV